MDVFKIILVCVLAALLASCATEGMRPLSERERDALEEEAYLKQEQARKRMIKDGFAGKDQDGAIIWKTNVVTKKFKILNKDQLNRGENKNKDLGDK